MARAAGKTNLDQERYHIINKARAIPAKLKGAAEKIGHTKGFHPLHTLIHTTYFSAVFLEGHGVYAMAGGGMAIFTIILAFAGSDGDHD